MAIKSLARSTVRQSQRNNSALAGYESNYFHHLETVRLGANTASIIFSNLSRYSDYQHLQIRGLTRCTNASSLAGSVIRFNGDSTSSYASHSLEGVNQALASTNGANSSSIGFYIPGNSGNTGSFASFIVDILDPFDSTKNTTTRTSSGFTYPGNWFIVQLTSGLWNNTTPISSISFAPNQNELLSGSSFSLYGLKARA